MHICGMNSRQMNMITPDHMPMMEAALASKGISVAELCRQANIAETTWGRWKAKKVSPNYKTWGAVSAAYSRLVGPQKQARAAQ